MKKGLRIFILVVIIGAVYFIFFRKGKDRPEGPKQQPLAVADNSNVFNQSYQVLLAAYDGVRTALVASDTTKASAAARDLRTAADSLKVEEIQGDSTGVLKETAKN